MDLPCYTDQIINIFMQLWIVWKRSYKLATQYVEYLLAIYIVYRLFWLPFVVQERELLKPVL